MAFDLNSISPITDEEFDTQTIVEDKTKTKVEKEVEKPKEDDVVITKLQTSIGELEAVTDEEFEEGLIEDEDPKIKVDNKVDNKQDNEPDSFVKELASLMKNKFEILPNLNLEEFDGTEEGLKNALLVEIKDGIDSYKNELPPVIKHLLDNWEENVPLEELINIKSNQIKFEGIDPDRLDEDGSEDLQRAILTQLYRETTSFTDVKIKKEVDKKIELGEVDEVKEALEELKQIEAQKEVELKALTKKQQAQWEEDNRKWVDNYKKSVYETKEIFPGIELSKKEQDAIFEANTKGLKITGSDKVVSRLEKVLIENPEKIKEINWFLEVTKDFTDISHLEKIFTTKATKKIDEVLKKSTPTSSSMKPGDGTKITNDLASLRESYERAKNKK
tara:strand:+ start:1897 stop:3063 length:1167 start_codon:yes stop_codon:yes gene_type:complete